MALGGLSSVLVVVGGLVGPYVELNGVGGGADVSGVVVVFEEKFYVFC